MLMIFFLLPLIDVHARDFFLLIIAFRFCSLPCNKKDFCRDESDCSDGYVTDGFATMDVFEYEVDDSSDSEDLYSHGSSSGTDV